MRTFPASARARWFRRYDRIRVRFDLVSLNDIADWLARDPGRVDRSESRRRQALADLRQSIAHGEFGMRQKPMLAFMPRDPVVEDPLTGAPKDPLTGAPKRFWVRPTAHQIETLPEMVEYLYAPRGAVLRWLEGRRYDAPPWLTADIVATEQAPTRPPVASKRRRETYVPLLAKLMETYPPGEAPRIIAIAFERQAQTARELNKRFPDLPRQRRTLEEAIERIRQHKTKKIK